MQALATLVSESKTMKVKPKKQFETKKVAAPVGATKPATGLKLTEPTVSIGNRGTALILAKHLPAGVVFGENPQLPKSGHDENTAPWLIVRAWISSRPHHFTVQPVSVALKKKLVTLVKGVTVVQTVTGKKFTVDALFPAGWNKDQKVPQIVAVMGRFPGGRVESKFCNEPPKNGKKVGPRNKEYVGKFVFGAA